MPNSYLSKINSEKGIPIEELEHKWKMAKKKAIENGEADNYGYIVSIFKHMIGENTLLTFKEFILIESIKPSFTEYGIDLKNKKWISILDDSKLKTYIKHTLKLNTSFMYYTFFEADNNYYQVYIGKNLYNNYPTVGFTYCYTKDFDVDKINNKDVEYLENNFTYDKSYLGTAKTIFNKFFYIVFQGIKLFKFDKVCFLAFDENLLNFYKSITNNKKFLETIQLLGFEYEGTLEQHGEVFFLFKKIV